MVDLIGLTPSILFTAVMVFALLGQIIRGKLKEHDGTSIVEGSWRKRIALMVGAARMIIYGGVEVALSLSGSSGPDIDTISLLIISAGIGALWHVLAFFTTRVLTTGDMITLQSHPNSSEDMKWNEMSECGRFGLFGTYWVKSVGGKKLSWSRSLDGAGELYRMIALAVEASNSSEEVEIYGDNL